MGSNVDGPVWPAYASCLLEKVKEQTGYPLVLVEEDGLTPDSQVRLARPGRPAHIVAHAPAYREFRLHFLVSGSVKVLRAWNTPPSQRCVPVIPGRASLPPEMDRELRQHLSWLPRERLGDLGRHLYQDLTGQVTSMPLDIRVERIIAATFPEHRSAQRAYLVREVEDLLPMTLPEVEAIYPERLYAANMTMNMVFAEAAAAITGLTVPRTLHQARFHGLAGRLHDHLAAAPNGYLGDRQVIDVWAKELGIRGWYEWIRLDALEVPP